MRLDTSQQMRTDMKLRMAPRMIQSMEILQLPLMALQERIDQELIENPILIDLRESTTAESEPEAEADSDAAPATTEAEEAPTGIESDDWDYGEGHRPSRAALSEEADRKHDAMQNMASRPESLSDYLANQLGFLDCDAKIRSLAEYIIYNLDPSGFLKPTLYDLVRDYAGDVTVEDAERALRLVQRLDPPGISAATSRSACSCN